MPRYGSVSSGARRAAALAALLAGIPMAGQQPEARFEVSSNLVVINASVRDRSGNPIEGLKKEDFQLLEDGKPQTISIFEFQRLSSDPLPPMIGIPASRLRGGPPAPARVEPGAPAAPPSPVEVRYKDRRLIVLFFDLSSMKPVEEIRAQQAALKFIETSMNAADMVAVMTFSSALELVEDFTADREKLAETIKNLPIGEMAGFGEDADADAGEETPADDDEANVLFMADSAEFNLFNTDRRLSALEAATRHLAALPEKKALVYFSSGVGKTGVENQSQLRATINAAQRSNVVFYPVDARGLIAIPPGGDATVAAKRGTGVFSGKTQRDRQMKMNDEQDTLHALAADTGGKALLDNNDLALGIVQAQRDLGSYYILGYYSTNAQEDGRFRRVTVRVPSQPRARLDYRSGYYASKRFKDFTAEDKERQLEEALQLGNPQTGLPLALEVNYFRLGRQAYFVPVAAKIPAAAIELSKQGAREQAELDFIGQVRDARGNVAGAVRDSIRVRLSGETAASWARRALQYDTGFVLAPGDYRIKFLVRENLAGRMGTFEARFRVPDLGALPEEALRMSSVVWASQREPLSAAVGSASNGKKLLAAHPLVRDGLKLAPSVTRVFRRSQSLYVYFEVYDPGRRNGEEAPSVSATLSLLRGGRKAFESEPVRVTRLAAGRQATAAFQFQAPLAKLPPGRYTCQVNVIDEIGGRFAFPRAPLILLP